MVVAPALYPLFKRKLPLASIAIGAAIPDIAGQIINDRDWAHEYSGMFSVDLIFGLIGCLLWFSLYRPYVYYGLNRQITPLGNSRIDAIFFCTVGILVGIGTHFLWDSFTHDNQPIFFSTEFMMQSIQVPLLHKTMPLDLFLQYTTSIITLPLVYFLIRPVLSAPIINTHAPNYWQFFLTLFSSVILGAIFCYLNTEKLVPLLDQDHYLFIRGLIVEFSTGFFLMFSVICLILRWKITRIY
ncbi:hypothetical protein BJI46_06635 [Acinetobacter qingfengensis]|uniref:DUF4184 family protein n=2 Tax=Acinetobacter qingfengensis TaxID=1262585 RepID=A0A1E7QXR9_9GAMM|nr:hypothetical protein BJI46_06635 [Acinetobacter qingfengensis]